MRIDELHVDADLLADLCEEHGAKRLEAFGSFVRGNAAPRSDLNILVASNPARATA